MIELPGEMDETVTEGAGKTVTVSVVFAVLPEASTALIESVCMPTSLATGTHAKFPRPPMSLSDIVEPGKESDSLYDWGMDPDATMEKLILLSANTFALGETDCTESDSASANASGENTIAAPHSPAKTYRRRLIALLSIAAPALARKKFVDCAMSIGQSLAII